MKVLGAYDREPGAMFVGGCVRGALIGRDPGDIDIATTHHPLQVIERLKTAGIRYVPTGLDHGTVTAIYEDAAFEITTLRKDIETDGRHAVIAFSTDWREDAMRRDFTMNTLLALPDGSVFDPTGRGADDLEARKVIFVGNPADRIAEDYLRILRFFRFHAQYGEGEADAAALEACHEYADKILKLSRERITQEFLKIIGVKNPSDILTLMFENGVLCEMAERYNAAAMAHLCTLQDRYDAKDVMARLSLLSGNNGDVFEDRLLLSNAQKKNIAELVDGLAQIKSANLKSIRALVYRKGNAVSLQAYLLWLTQRSEMPDMDLIDIARYWHAPTFPIGGNDLMNAGILPGPTLGEKLMELEEKWIAKDFPSDFDIKK